MATAFGVRVAWYRFGSPFDIAAMIGDQPTASFVPEIYAVEDDYQSGTKLPHSKGSADLIYAQVSWLALLHSRLTNQPAAIRHAGESHHDRLSRRQHRLADERDAVVKK